MKRFLIVLLVLGGLSLGAQTSEAQFFFRSRLGLGINNVGLRIQNARLRNNLAFSRGLGFRNNLAFSRGAVFRDNLAFARGVRLRGVGLSNEIRFQNRLRNDLDRRDFILQRQAIRRQAIRRQALRERNLRLQLGVDSCY